MANPKDFLYPEIEPYNVAALKVSDLHTIVYEEVGNPEGRPALFLHGGPGVGITPAYRRFFDPEHYRIVLLDQRGAGRSTPHAEIRENTTEDIVADLETLRRHLGVDDWVVMGGSWGSLLALCYAIRHPTSVAAMILRGIFLGRQFEIDWIHGPNGAALVYPEEYERYKAMVPDAEDTVGAYCELLGSDDKAARLEAAKAWSRWEGVMVTVMPDPEGLEEMLDSPSALSIARIESKYTKHGFHIENEHWVLDNASAMADIPAWLVHGRFDMVCPPISAWELHKALPKSKLVIVPDGAHSPVDGGMTEELVKASDAARDQGI